MIDRIAQACIVPGKSDAEFLVGPYVPPPPYVPSPLLWGDETTCRQRLGADVRDLAITRYMYPIEYPFEPAKVVDFFIEYLRADQPGVRIAR